MFWHYGGEGRCCCWDRCRYLAVEHRPMMWARLRQGWRARAQRRAPRMERGAASCRGGLADKAVALQDVVGEGEPAQCAQRLIAAAHGDLVERPLAAARVDAVGNAAALVAGLAGGAAHAPAPGGDAGAVVVPWREGIGVVLAARRRAVNGDALAGRPFDVRALGEAAVGEMAARQAAEAAADRLQHRPDQPAVGARGGDADPDHHLLPDAPAGLPVPSPGAA